MEHLAVGCVRWLQLDVSSCASPQLQPQALKLGAFVAANGVIHK